MKAQKSKFSLILFVYNLMIGCYEKNIILESDFEQKEKRINIYPRVSANRPSNNRVQVCTELT